jgi:methylthioribulose-1-phosphate dehydratase
MTKKTPDPRDTLSRHAAIFHGRGWMAGTAGNLSARADDGVWITASGRSKGALARADFVRLAADGTPAGPGGRAGRKTAAPAPRPSAESGIHLAIYRLFPGARACYHVHTVESNLAARLGTSDWLPLPGLEMLKGFGLGPSDLPVAAPVFDNHERVADIARDIERRFAAEPPAVPVLLVRNHGLTTWGPDTEAAFNHVELAEYVFRYLVVARLLRL